MRINQLNSTPENYIHKQPDWLKKENKNFKYKLPWTHSIWAPEVKKIHRGKR